MSISNIYLKEISLVSVYAQSAIVIIDNCTVIGTSKTVIELRVMQNTYIDISNSNFINTSGYLIYHRDDVSTGNFKNNINISNSNFRNTKGISIIHRNQIILKISKCAFRYVKYPIMVRHITSGQLCSSVVIRNSNFTECYGLGDSPILVQHYQSFYAKECQFIANRIRKVTKKYCFAAGGSC